MMRFGSSLYLTPAGIGLIMVTLLLVGAIVVRVMTVSEHGEIRAHTASENGNRVTWILVSQTWRGFAAVR